MESQFNASSSKDNENPIRQTPGTKLTAIDLPALQSASNVLLEQLSKDAQIIPDLGEIITSAGSQVSASYSVFPDDIRVPFQKRKFLGIPEGLFQFTTSANVVSHMGLMPEIERAWISIDHKLFLWDYNDGQELASFLDQPDVITHVAIVRPKQGMFVDDIQHLLVICTPISVLLIGVALSPVQGPENRIRKELQLYATDLSVSTDVEMGSVIGTEDGRIFMRGAQDGHLYEFHYQEKDSWFGKKVHLIDHSRGAVQSLLPRFVTAGSEERIMFLVSDSKRKCFYALTSYNSISIFTPNGEKSVQHVQTLSSLYKSVREKVPVTPHLTTEDEFTIIGLHVIDPTDSRGGLQLVAVSSSGIRLFFAPSFGYGYPLGSAASSGPRPLQLVHVRLPPTNLIHPDEQARMHRPQVPNFGASQFYAQPKPSAFQAGKLTDSAYADGLTVIAQKGDAEGTDFILCFAPDLSRIGSLGLLNHPQPSTQPAPYTSTYDNYGNHPGNPNRPPLTEYATVLAIPGRTWAAAAIPRAPSVTPSGTPTPKKFNELATQFGESPNQFVLLTNVGLTLLVKRRTLDFLKAALEELQSQTNFQPIIEFRDSFGRDQTCAMLLGLASGNTFLDPSSGQTPSTIVMVSPEIAAVAKQAFYDFGERPIWTERVMYGTSENKGSAIFSGRREGFALYFARLVRPIWKANLTAVLPSGQRTLNVSETILVNVQKNLFALKDFLTRNPHLFQSSPSETTTSRTLITEQEAWKAEQKSVSELQSLLSRTIEALSFVLLLNDYHLGELIAKCDAEVQKLISSVTSEDLITTQHGMTISRALVNVVIDQQIGQQISVDTISEILQQRCGSFCSTDDVMLYKAKESIRKAAETRNPAERHKYLAEALRLFAKGARILEFEKLREIIGDFQHLGYAKGAVELPLTCAQAQDPDNAGLECWHANGTEQDPRFPLVRQRLQCYDLILDSLSVFEEKCNRVQANSGVPSLNDPETVRSHAYELSFASEDEIFHSTLYDWLISRNLADDLLEMRPAYLEAHLRRDPPSLHKFQLLWKFYVKNGQPLRAAEVLGAMAESTEFEVELDSRLEYLTLAVANAKSHPISAGGRHETAIAFLSDLEEKLDVAQVQLEIYNTLLPHVNDAPEVGDRIKMLSKQLLTMTDLYQKFAVPFDLPATKLLCLHVSEHRDEGIVRPIWSQIFDEIMEETNVPADRADLIVARIVPLGHRFYPSECAFPLREGFIAMLIVRFLLANKDVLPVGWAARLLIQCGVQFAEIWDVFNEMYESQVPPFNDQANVQTISSEIAILITDWITEATRPQAKTLRLEFPVARVDSAIDHYLSELETSRKETKALYENARRELRKYW